MDSMSIIILFLRYLYCIRKNIRKECETTIEGEMKYLSVVMNKKLLRSNRARKDS